MIEELTHWRFRCDTCGVTSVVASPAAHGAPGKPEGWRAEFGERGPSGYPKRVHRCEVCALRAAEKESEER